MQTLSHRQRTAHHGHGVLPLPVTGTSTASGVLSPYFQRSSLQEIGTGRNIRLFLAYMKALVGYIYDLQSSGSRVGSVQVGFYDEDEVVGSVSIEPNAEDAQSLDDFVSFIESQVLAYASSQSYGMTAEDIIWGAVATLPGLPGAAIANAPADAVTNYNVITTLLGTLTGAVNEANTKQNAIATKLNTLLAELRSAGIIAT